MEHNREKWGLPHRDGTSETASNGSPKGRLKATYIHNGGELQGCSVIIHKVMFLYIYTVM